MNNFLIKNLYKNSDGQVAEANDVQYRLWVKFIETMNDKARDAGQDAHWSGDSEGDFYGIVEGEWKLIGEYEMRPDVEYMTIEQWNTRFIESLVVPTEEPTEVTDDVPMVTDYNGNLIPQSDAWLFSDDSCHAGEYFHQDEYYRDSIVVCLDHGDGYALRDECETDIDDNWFVVDRAEYYDLTWSDYNDRWVCENDDYVYYGFYDRSNRTGYFYSDECVCAGDEYYADSGVAEYHGWYWNDNRDCYVHEDDDDDYESDDVQENNANYHKLERQFRFGDNPKFSIGFEIEKEDSDVGLIHFKELYNSTGWCKEKDGSLNNYGYELVSPAFNLYTGDLEKEINTHADLLRLINGGHSSRCGGHINIASSEFNTEQLFEALSGFFPLLYAIYPHRIEQHYCKAKKKHRYYDKDKFSAVYIKENVLEFRIFPAVKHYDNLLWRRDLMRIMCDNVNKSEADVLKMLINSNSKLHKHLRKIYDHESLIVRIERFIDHCKLYNNKKLNKVDFAKSKEIVATGVNSDDLAC